MGAGRGHRRDGGHAHGRRWAGRPARGA
jgi:hypothetical protein